MWEKNDHRQYITYVHTIYIIHKLDMLNTNTLKLFYTFNNINSIYFL